MRERTCSFDEFDEFVCQRRIVMHSRRWTAALSGALLMLASCGPNIRPVEYRLPAIATGPIDHGTVKDGRKDFGAVFRATLDHMNDTGGKWGDYRKYIELDEDVTASASELKPVRILVVAGVFSECLEASGVKAFLDAKKHFDAHHKGVSLEHVTVSGFGTSDHNADEIQKYVTAHPGDNFVAVGYSKGAGDWMQAIVKYPDDVAHKMLALVTIAGSVGGSRLPDLLGKDLIHWAEATLRDTG